MPKIKNGVENNRYPSLPDCFEPGIANSLKLPCFSCEPVAALRTSVFDVLSMGSRYSLSMGNVNPAPNQPITVTMGRNDRISSR